MQHKMHECVFLEAGRLGTSDAGAGFIPFSNLCVEVFFFSVHHMKSISIVFEYLPQDGVKCYINILDCLSNIF